MRTSVKAVPESDPYVEFVVTESAAWRGLLSLRMPGNEDRPALVRFALKAAGFQPGDVVEIRIKRAP